MSEQAERPRRIVLKIGSAVIAPRGPDGAAPRLDPEAIGRLANAVSRLCSAGVEVVMVSSGAIPCGLSALGLRSMPRTIVERQAAAAVGQSILMRAYAQALAWHSLTPAQLLITGADVEHRRRFINAHRTVETLLARGLVPIFNENDSVSFEEIRFGDNDRLAALVACLVDADLLVLLSTADGLRADGGRGELIPVVRDLDAATRHVADTRSSVGTGGMVTKLDAAGIATRSGIPVLLAGGRTDVPALLGLGGPVPPHTRFEPAAHGALRRRRAWLAFAAAVRGSIRVDAGAARALATGAASLLPVGITAAEGDFGRGDLVELVGPDGTAIARGLTSYAGDEVRRLAGLRTEEIGAALGYHYADEVVHREDLVLINAGDPGDRAGKNRS